MQKGVKQDSFVCIWILLINEKVLQKLFHSTLFIQNERFWKFYFRTSTRLKN